MYLLLCQDPNITFTGRQLFHCSKSTPPNHVTSYRLICMSHAGPPPTEHSLTGQWIWQDVYVPAKPIYHALSLVTPALRSLVTREERNLQRVNHDPTSPFWIDPMVPLCSIKFLGAIHRKRYHGRIYFELDYVTRIPIPWTDASPLSLRFKSAESELPTSGPGTSPSPQVQFTITLGRCVQGGQEDSKGPHYAFVVFHKWGEWPIHLPEHACERDHVKLWNNMSRTFKHGPVEVPRSSRRRRSVTRDRFQYAITLHFAPLHYNPDRLQSQIWAKVQVDSMDNPV